MTIQHKMILSEARDYMFIALGLFIYTIAFTVFLMPYQIVAGGVTGLSAIIYYATGFHLENTYIIINGVLLVVALKILGWRFLMKTIFAIFTLYFMLRFAQDILPKQVCADRYRIGYRILEQWFDRWYGCHCSLSQQVPSECVVRQRTHCCRLLHHWLVYVLPTIW